MTVMTAVGRRSLRKQVRAFSNEYTKAAHGNGTAEQLIALRRKHLLAETALAALVRLSAEGAPEPDTRFNRVVPAWQLVASPEANTTYVEGATRRTSLTALGQIGAVVAERLDYMDARGHDGDTEATTESISEFVDRVSVEDYSLVLGALQQAGR